MAEYLSENEYKRLFPGISKSCIAKTLAMGAVESSLRKPGAAPALDQKRPARQKSSPSVALVCSIICCRHRLLDDDNSIAGCKPLRDSISRMLGIDDADPRIKWEYGQIQTNGEQGCIVKLEWKTL